MMTGILARLLWRGGVYSGGGSKKYLNPEKGPQSLQYTLNGNLGVIPIEAWSLSHDSSHSQGPSGLACLCLLNKTHFPTKSA